MVDHTIYQLLIWGVPVIIGLFGFIGALGVNALINMNRSLQSLNVKLEKLITKHEDLEERVDKIEEKMEGRPRR
jgi:predicted ATP-grasp superfamily ATP-dependent carboligase